jgi:hypothetical protein
MTAITLIKRTRRAVWAHGYRGAAIRAVRAIRPHREGPDRFDAEHGTDTAGIVRLEGLSVGPNGRYGVRYQPSDADIAIALLQALPIDHSEFAFVDIGSGKGRILLAAAGLPFKRVVGVEFAEDLCRIAERNARLVSRDRIEVVCADATEYDMPPEPLVLYFYNPFLPPIMRRVMARVAESLRAHPRAAYVVLLGDQALAAEVVAAGFTPADSPEVWQWPL